MSETKPEPIGCFAIRLHRRRWLRLTPGCERSWTGWRPFTWTPDFAEAEKFGTREAAAEFAGILGLRSDFEIVS